MDEYESLFNFNFTDINNGLDDDDDSQGVSHQWNYYPNIIILITCFIVGLVGNSFIICIVPIYSSTRRRSSNYLIWSLAIGDLSYILMFPMILSALFHKHESWTHGLAMCKLSFGLSVLKVVLSPLLLLLMAISKISEGVCRAEKLGKWLWIVILFIVWAVSISYSIVAGNMASILEFGAKDRYCVEQSGENRSTFTELVNHVLPTIILVPAFVVLLLQKFQLICKQSSTEGQEHLAYPLVLVFNHLICSISWAVLFIWIHVGSPYSNWRMVVVLHFIGMSMLAINSALDPILAICYVKSIRRSLANIVPTKQLLCSRSQNSEADQMPLQVSSVWCEHEPEAHQH